MYAKVFKKMSEPCSKCKKDFVSIIKLSGQPFKTCNDCRAKSREKIKSKKIEQEMSRSYLPTIERKKRINEFKDAYMEKIKSDLNEDPKEEVEKRCSLMMKLWSEAGIEDREEMLDFIMCGRVKDLNRALKF